MDIELTKEHLLIANSAKEFAKREIYPTLKERDEKAEPDYKALKKMGKDGFLGICIPKKYGGQGMDYISLGLICLEFEKIDTSARVVLSVHTGLNSLSLLQWGSEEQKTKYLTPLAQGEKIGAFGLTEPNAGSDVLGIQATAQLKGDNYILNGEKTWISLAEIADIFLIFAYTNKEKKHNGISAFIVEKNSPGVTTSTICGKLGVRAGNTGSISFQDVKIPRENLLGKEGDGFKIAMSALDNGRYTVASGAVGIIEACLETSVKYAHERETFGQEIGRHQLVQQMIAKMAASRDIGRLLFYNAGYLKNHGRRNTKETSLAKWINCNNAFESANDALQILGAYGYSNEFDIERYFRNSRGAMIYEGTREIHTIMQAEYALGYRQDKPLEKNLPSWPFEND
ncbi:MAG: butyryl-CoA dehydrogenase [Candidatus Melainabacteria bacterium RIFCSPLOWO2_02_FULL_35_15]|nr:MAG: butyryl-CoA dehydrogenase [Candidatus Melainabacteria bacterium RIFCSPLOWO2_12_FULL_35_11]OGI14686.1 MAG: butyryl-CoA dehydrogenase [Candidatus Melainabacteria bacterium RIFCSPLOWO2_02_FULL_35_15]